MADTPAAPRRSRAADVVRAVRRLTLDTQHYIDEVARRTGAHRTDVAAIGLILDADRDGERLTPGELARRAGLSAAAVSALVDRLERVGHATRARHDRDRRMVVVDATDVARGVSREMFAPLNDEMNHALDRYTDADLALVARVLEDLADAADQARSAGPTGEQWGDRSG